MRGLQRFTLKRQQARQARIFVLVSAMITKNWQLQEAKNHFSEVVERAIKDGAQTVTKHGKPAVMIISVEDYQKTISPRKSLIQLLRECPENLADIIGPRSKEPARTFHFDP